jgi:hypothetical protein
MKGIVELRRRLRPQAKTGGRTHMTSVEVRAAIFAVRVNTAKARGEKLRYRKVKVLRTKQILGIDPAALEELKKKSARTIDSLERHMKRADFHLHKQVTAQKFSEFMNSWRANLRWIRLHLAYFKPLLSGPFEGRKTRFQIILKELIEVAKDEIRMQGYLPPNDQELRRVMLLYSCSSRRFREGPWTPQYIVAHHSRGGARWHLFDFIQKRIPLESATEG